MRKISTAFALGVAACLLVSLACASTPARTVNIKLQDSGEAAMAGMRVVVDHEKVKAGRVTLVAHNESKKLVHEMVVVSVTAPGNRCRMTKKRRRLSKAAFGDWAMSLRPFACSMHSSMPASI